MRAVILAGGKGTRLVPYTTVLPKPLMPIGDIPILEIIIRQLKRAGIDHITIAVGHLSNLLMAFFDDGKKYGLDIDYSLEDQPLGTVGPLKLIDGLDNTFFLMNGDVLTTLDYSAMLAYHRQHKAVATIAMHARAVQIDLGVIETDGSNFLTAYIEKPTYNYHASMGIYIFEPRVLRYIPQRVYLDFPQLIWKLLEAKEPVLTYPYDGYWQDIGCPEDYASAIEEFDRMRGLILGEKQT
jgi:NDP-sugar pyrophosphorylase family protein